MTVLLTRSTGDAEPASIPLAGRYAVLGPLGRGGMSQVWLADDRRLRRQVAIKEMLATRERAPTDTTMWTEARREVRAAARAIHPYVVRVYDLIDFRGRPGIVMEYLPARSLHSLIADSGTLASSFVAAVGLSAVEAIAAVHRAGIVHRDVKPSNILVCGDGRVVLTDFGIATPTDSTECERDLVGTPEFIAPERVTEGRSLPEGDLWALGATLYTAIEGRSPYARNGAVNTLHAIATLPPRPPRAAGKLVDLIGGLLQRDPHRRPSTAEVRRVLGHLVAGGGSRARSRDQPWDVGTPDDGVIRGADHGAEWCTTGQSAGGSATTAAVPSIGQPRPKGTYTWGKPNVGASSSRSAPSQPVC